MPLRFCNSSRSDRRGHGGVKSITASPIATFIEPWMSSANDDTNDSTISMTAL